MNIRIGIFLLACVLLTQTYAEKINSQTVKNVNIGKYLGTWYEVARFPHSFEKNLDRVTATYSVREDGKIKVENTGYLPDGKQKTAIGKAYIPDASDASRLKVSFFWIFYGDYFILELDEKNYQWAMVGSGTSDYLWILSRAPKLDDKIYAELLNRAGSRGYDLSKLIKVRQE